MKSNNKNNALEQELATKTNELEQQRNAMLKKGVKLTLADIVNKIESHSAEITALMSGKIQKAQLQNLAASVIADGTDVECVCLLLQSRTIKLHRYGCLLVHIGR